jgi:dGTPase
VPYALADYNALHDLELYTHASGEAQVAALSDDIAYNHHDIHDGLRAELFSTDDLLALPIVGDCFREVDAIFPDLDKYRRRHEALRRFFGVLVEDVIGVSRANLADIGPQTCSDIRGAGRMMVQFSPALWADLKVVRKFLFEQMYRAPRVVKMRADVTQVVEDLFPLFMADTSHLPKQWRKDVAAAKDETALARIVSDYISGMTDRFAIETHKRLVR